MNDNTNHPTKLRSLLPTAIHTFWRSLPQFLTYQLWTKLLFSGLLLPGFWLLARALMAGQGMQVITNSTLAEFMLQKEGAILAAVALLLVFLGIILELFGFITISARTLHGEPEARYLSLVFQNLKLIPKLLGFGGLLLTLYLLLIVPLSGAGIGLSFISVRIPNFITQVIEANPWFLAGYLLLLLSLAIVGIRWIFTLHFIVIGKLRPLHAMRASAAMYRKNRRSFLLTLLVLALLGALAAGLLLTGWYLGVLYLAENLDFERAIARSLMLGLFMLQGLVGFFGAILYVPFDVHVVTLLFYRYAAGDEKYAGFHSFVPVVKEKVRLSPLDRLLKKRFRFVLISLLLIALIAGVAQGFFGDFFTAPYPAQIVAHRAGGFGTPENSFSGLEYAIRRGADYTEVDVQRTKDGAYILNHDSTFRRALGVNLQAEDLTLAEIQSYSLVYPGEQKETVPELSAFLDKAKGRIRVMLELKGSTADEQMAEDVIRLAREKSMENDIVITSLNYRLIEYIEENHPDILTGFIYFLSFGDISALEGDYLIMEEGLATASRIAEIRAADKKSVVWTVNQPSAMNLYLERGIDAIITDEVEMLEVQLAIQEAKSLQERIAERFLPIE